MTLSKFKSIVSTAVLVGIASSAQAGFVKIDADVTPLMETSEISNANDFKGIFNGLGVTDYTLGASLGVDVAGTVSYWYFGKEAGYRNDFSTGGLSYSSGFTPTMQNKFGAPVYIGSVDVGPGALDFRFCAFSSPTVSQGCLTNLQNDGVGLGAYQSIAFSTSGNLAWLFWDDSGAGPDDNHDDMLIKAVFSPRSVPEPATLGLFGLGLLGTWFAFSRRQRKSFRV
jgi:PEP-CTERM motif